MDPLSNWLQAKEEEEKISARHDERDELTESRTASSTPITTGQKNEVFGLDLLQCVSDWQKGGDEKQKRRRGQELKRVCSSLPEEFRSVSQPCYRQVSLEPAFLVSLASNLNLTETISSWTTSYEVAKAFKGGVPPPGYQGVIFELTKESACEVIVNIDALFGCGLFVSALRDNESKIRDYGHGIGRYENSQKEAVICVEYVALKSIRAWGGYSSSERDLARKFLGHEPSEDESEQFKLLLSSKGKCVGPKWVDNPEAVTRYASTIPTILRDLQERKAKKREDGSG